MGPMPCVVDLDKRIREAPPYPPATAYDASRLVGSDLRRIILNRPKRFQPETPIFVFFGTAGSSQRFPWCPGQQTRLALDLSTHRPTHRYMAGECKVVVVSVESYRIEIVVPSTLRRSGGRSHVRLNPPVQVHSAR